LCKLCCSVPSLLVIRAGAPSRRTTSKEEETGIDTTLGDFLSLSHCRPAAHISLSPSSQLHDSARTQVSRKSPSPSDRQRSATLAEPPAPSISDEQPVRRVQPVQAQGRCVLARRSCTGFTPYLGNLEGRCFCFLVPSGPFISRLDRFCIWTAPETIPVVVVALRADRLSSLTSLVGSLF
jgi:hypothetical protein